MIIILPKSQPIDGSRGGSGGDLVRAIRQIMRAHNLTARDDSENRRYGDIYLINGTTPKMYEFRGEVPALREKGETSKGTTKKVADFGR